MNSFFLRLMVLMGGASFGLVPIVAAALIDKRGFGWTGTIYTGQIVLLAVVLAATAALDMAAATHTPSIWVIPKILGTITAFLIVMFGSILYQSYQSNDYLEAKSNAEVIPRPQAVKQLSYTMVIGALSVVIVSSLVVAGSEQRNPVPEGDGLPDGKLPVPPGPALPGPPRTPTNVTTLKPSGAQGGRGKGGRKGQRRGGR